MKNSIRTLVAVLALIVSVEAYGAIPYGYYTPINGKKEAELKKALKNVILPHTEVSSYNALPEYFRHTDVIYYNGEETWWDMYSNLHISTSGKFGTYMNREHSFPKSWWGGLTDTPAYTDLNHLYPGNAVANEAKSNWPLGTVSKASFDNGVSKVGSAVTGQGGGAKNVFEPANEYKGDFARTYFYMVTAYSDLTWTRNYMWMLQQNEYPTLTGWAQSLLLKWSREDPVSQKEIDRNEQVYKIQNNRNPFIDYPELAEYLWGEKKGMAFYLEGGEEPAGEPNLITPVQDMALDFFQVAKGNKTTSRLYFKGENCVGDFTITIAGTNKAYFTVDTRSISASNVNSASGYWLTVTYTPTELGMHTARLIISDGGLTGSRGIELRGECLPVPTLTRLTATSPTNITSDSYTANWNEPAGDEVVDYYIVTRTRYVGGNASSEEIIAETNHLDIEDFDASDNETYSVQSVRLGYRSPMSNVISVSHAGINGVKTDSPLAANCYPGAIVFTCAEVNTNACVYDMSGRLVRIIPELTDGMEVTLPNGIYLIVTDQHRTPLKAVAF